MANSKSNKFKACISYVRQNWQLGLCASAGLFAHPLPRTWYWLLAMAVFYATFRRPLTWGLWGATGLFVFWTGASAPWTMPISLWLMFCACCLFFGATKTQRQQSLAPSIVLATPFLLVAFVLYRSGWSDEARLMLGHVRGGCLAATYLLWSWPGCAGTNLRCMAMGWLCVLVSLCCMGLSTPRPSDTILPAWRLAETLQETDPLAHLVQKLWRLQAAGAKDAADVLVDLAMEHNTSPKMLRRLCRKQGFDAGLNGAWQTKRELGRTACTALHMAWPEAGAAYLQAATEPELQRLRADLLWEAGCVDQAQQLQTAQIAAEQTFARSNLRMSRAQRGCTAARVAFDDPVQQGFVAWTQALQEMDWGRLGDRVFQPIDVPGHVTMVWDAQLRQMVTATVSAFGGQFGLTLPLPEHQVLPAALKLMMRAETLPRIEIQMSHGHTQIFDCVTQIPASFGVLQTPVSHWPLPRTLCQLQQWTKVILPVRYATADTRIERITLHGTFRLGAFETVPQRQAPVEPTPEDGEIQHKQDVL